MKIWFDTEFIDDGRTIDLISIGIVREDGATYYAESADCDLSRACEWVKQNVLPHLTGNKISRHQMKSEIVEFCGSEPEFWAYFSSYDWVVLCQLYGRMMELPPQWPMWCRDLKQFAWQLGRKLSNTSDSEHNALQDAIWCRNAWMVLDALMPPEPTSQGQGNGPPP